ncbi:MAG: MazG nucleotide pyrophosphohydrolase domain-containing protein [Culicoidibacterales bacterium]
MLISNTIILSELEKTKIDNDDRELAMKLSEEANELFIELVCGTDDKKIKEELADVYIVLAQIAQMYEFTEFDLVDKLEDVKRRYKKGE